MTISVYWLITAAVFLALEAFGIPGIGFLFAGIAAFIVGLAVELRLIDALNYTAQGAVFFVLTCAFAVALWKKLKHWRLNPNAPVYSNILGTEATVTRPLIGGEEGEVRWSGTLMRARLQPGSAAEALVGATVIVTAIEGTLLTVTPK